MKKLSKTIVRLIIFLVLSGISITVVLLLTVNEETFASLQTISPFFLLYCLGIWICVITFDAIGVLFFIRGTGEKIRLKDAYKLSVIRIFFNLITPFTFGGQPFMIFVLNKFGIPSGKGSTIVMTRLLCVGCFILIAGTLSLLIVKESVSSNPLLSNTFLITAILLICLFIILILVMLFPPIMKSVLSLIGKVGHKLTIIKDINGFNDKTAAEINSMRNSFINYFGKHFGSFILAFFFTAASIFLHVIIILVIINGLGVSMTPQQGIISGLLLLFCISYMPTPGSSGLGEGIFVLIYKGYIPLYLIGVVVILWRFFYQYLSAIGGALISSRIFSKIIITDK
jgi:glycosyltransferase 2 family protein